MTATDRSSEPAEVFAERLASWEARETVSVLPHWPEYVAWLRAGRPAAAAVGGGGRDVIVPLSFDPTPSEAGK